VVFLGRLMAFRKAIGKDEVAQVLVIVIVPGHSPVKLYPEI
jgi:hypothetical protein